MMSPYIITILIVLILVVVALIIWISYCLVPTYQQTIAVKLNFENTYRYIPHFNEKILYKLDNIKVVVTGCQKKHRQLSSSIISSLALETIIKNNVTNFYKNSVLIHEADSFNVSDKLISDGLRRLPQYNIPTTENLSILIFNNLSSELLNNGCQLIEVTLNSGGTKVSHYRKKHMF